MLHDFESSQPMPKEPYPELMDIIRSRISPRELAEIHQTLDIMIEGTEIQTSSWMPGNDWSDTPFDPIYQKCALKNEELAAKMFGLIVWDIFQQRDEVWYTGRFELNGEPINGRTYFRPQGS